MSAFYAAFSAPMYKHQGARWREGVQSVEIRRTNPTQPLCSVIDGIFGCSVDMPVLI
jgi:hypothetical protein